MQGCRDAGKQDVLLCQGRDLPGRLGQEPDGAKLEVSKNLDTGTSKLPRTLVILPRAMLGVCWRVLVYLEEL